MEKNSTTSTVPLEWPGAFGIFKTSRDAVRQNLSTIVYLWLALFIVYCVIGFILDVFLSTSVALIMKELISVLAGTYFTIGTIYVYISSASSRKVELKSALTIPWSLYWKVILLNLLVLISVIGGLVLLIVPGVIIALRLSLAEYYLVDQNLSVLEAYKSSWEATKGNLGKIWGITGLVVLMTLPVITIVGVVATVYLLFMYSTATAFLYLYLLQKPTKSQ